MKISLPNHSSGVLLTKKQGLLCIISSAVIGFFFGVGGSYVLQDNSRASVITLLSIVGILVCLGGAVGTLTLLSWSKIDEVRSAPAKKNVPRIISEWHYRPREASRRFAVMESTSAESCDVLSPEPFVANNNNVWWNKNSY